MAQNKSYILSINCGSSSIKFALYEEDNLKCHWRGHINGIGHEDSVFQVTDNNNKRRIIEMQRCNDNRSAIDELCNWLSSHYLQYPIVAIGHRIVQGGPDHRAPELIDDQLIHDLEQLLYLAPNHLPAELTAIKCLVNAFPEAVQVACYDTFFHQSLPGFVKLYPLPEQYLGKGLMKYGFHGLSYEYILQQLDKEFKHINHKKIIIAHLGNGASMVAVQHGKSIDTTMGLTPIGGLLMSTRCGDIDPGVLLFLQQQYKLSAADLDELLSKKSGMKAIAGTGDMQELLEREENDTKAAEAVTAFVYSVKKNIGALAAAMDGLDMLVFTGGIGENAAVIREHVCDGLSFLGVHVNQKRNKHHQQEISSAESKVKVLVMPTDEEGMIAYHTQDIIYVKN